MQSQFELHLPAPAVTGDVPLVPARMVNEYVYCPRLAYLMWTQSEWAETGDTVEGQRIHARVDKSSAPLPSPQEVEASAETAEPVASRALTLSSTTLGVIAKLDVVEADNGIVTPVDYKRGKRPHVAQGVYEPERIQVCLQAMLLEEHGYRVDQGMIYYAGSRERVRVILDDDLRMASRAAVNALRLIVSQGRIPPPLSDSPKCPRCALVTVCLPDEMGSIAGSSLAPRPIAVPTSTALPLIVQSQYARLSKDGETLKVNDEEAGETIVRMIDISDVALFGNVAITTPALTALLERDIPVSFHSHGGWFRGMAHGVGHRNVDIRTAQYRLSFDEAACLRFARDLVEAKVFNQRTMLRRNWRGTETTRQDCLDRLSAARRATRGAASAATLLGIEGDAAATYFRGLAGLLKPPPATTDGDHLRMFRFDARNRRPPTDPVNAMLSLGYAMLTRHFTVALASVGLDPYRGFYHAPRYGRPALALDIMEPFRPLVVDSVVLSAINTGEIGTADFVVAATGTSLTQAGRRRFVAAFERRLSQETTHPLFGYQLTLRRLVIVQARLLTRFLLGEMPAYPHYLPR
jgi:CRISPR-associated endonuclease Cas1/CRISPR-associated protein Cas4